MNTFQNIFIRIPILLIMSNSCIFSQVRPGKGMDVIPGDVAEFTITQHSASGEVSKLPSSIMLALGSQGNMERVAVLSAIGEELKRVQMVTFDLSVEKTDKGELIEDGIEVITILGTDYECSWQKRRSGDIIMIFWRCPKLPFEHLAKSIVEMPDGRKQITELVYFGPPTVETEISKAFQLRLKNLSSQASNNK